MTTFNDNVAVNTRIDATTIVATTFNGTLTGNTYGQHKHESYGFTSTGNILLRGGLLMLSHASTAIAATFTAAPAAGEEFYIVNTSASGTAAHTVKCSAGVTFDGTNNTATFNAPGEALHIIATSTTRWFILENIGEVGLSST